jgi:hydroxyacylglutathione hydrolase
MTRNVVLIAGGGASGALVATNLLKRSPGTRIIVVEPALSVGRGMAYSTTCREHLLNVAAGRMSAFPDDPRHFSRWLAARGYTQFTERSFVPRMIYGEYLEWVLNEARENAEFGRFTHLRARVAGFRERAGRIALELADGRSVEGDQLVLALGNAAPAPWPGLSEDATESGNYFGSAWTPGATAPRDVDEAVLLIGTGLTAVDAVLALRYNRHRGPIVMVSRRGLLPKVHRLFDCAKVCCQPAGSALELLRNMRASAAEANVLHENWRVAVDAIREQTNDLWDALPLTEQRRFQRHLRAYWDVHRHRMAPEIAAKMKALQDSGALRAMAGRVGRIESSRQGMTVTVTPRGGREARRFEVGRVINCTGAEPRLSRLPNPLVQAMLREGVMVEHPLRTGVLVNRDGALIAKDGSISDRVYAMGPLRIGTLIESVAIPEIRRQAREVADLLATRRSQPILQKDQVQVASEFVADLPEVRHALEPQALMETQRRGILRVHRSQHDVLTGQACP